VADRAADPCADPQLDTTRSLLAAIVASSNDAIVGMDLNGVVTSWNAAAERLFGFSAAEMIGQPITRIIPPGRIAEEDEILRRIRRGERLSRLETERLTRNGAAIPVSLTISPIHGAGGHLVGVSKIVRDLSETHSLNRELERRKALLESILATAPHGLIVTDQRGVVLSFSPAAEAMFGYAAGEVLNRKVGMLMPQTERQQHEHYLARYLATGQQRVIGIGREVVARRKDGSTFPIELQIGEVRVAGAHLFTGFVRDLTERRERERRLADLQADLIHVSRLSELGQMVCTLAHEVNQPLTAIANYIGGIRRLLPADSPATLHQALERIAEQDERARGIIRSLRGLVKKESPPRQPENLEAIIRETAELALLGAGGAVALNLRIAADASHALVDKVQIQQVILNLMRNAVDAMDGAPIRRLTIATARQADSGRVEVQVSDTGPGLPDAVRQRLFEPFFTTKADGLGIGLSICRTIVAGHDGELLADGAPGRGTTFRFTLPAAAPPAPTRPAQGA
jgi:two-component system sensor kinase FixL